MKTTQDSITEEIEKQIGDIVDPFFYDDGYRNLKFNIHNLLSQALTRQRIALIEQIEREVIGEDEDEVKLQEQDEKLGIQRYYVITANQKRRNELRAEQRAKLNALRKEV